MPLAAPNDTLPSVTVTEEIAAPPADVFEALVDAEELGSWFGAPNGGDTTGWQFDAVEGGEWRATTRAPDGTEQTIGGTVVEIDAPRRLAFTWREEGESSEPGLVHFTLDEIFVNGDVGTRLTVTHTMAALSLGTHASYENWWRSSATSLAHHLGLARYTIVC